MAVLVAAVTWPSLGFAQLSDDEYARQALAAGPESVAKNATVVRPEPDGSMRTIRQGTNEFTCLIMGTDRMCADKNSMEFIHALMHHQPPPNQIGFSYMLGGDVGPSGELGGTCNSSPYATLKTLTATGSLPDHTSCSSARRARLWVIHGRLIPIPANRI
jgi:hypothetical protein